MANPFKKVSATYSMGMLLYYLLYVFYFKRDSPTWLSELYMLVYSLPALAGLLCKAKTNHEDYYKNFLACSFIIFMIFDFWCMFVGEGMLFFNRLISAILMVSLPLAFLALFLNLKFFKKEIEL